MEIVRHPQTNAPYYQKGKKLIPLSEALGVNPKLLTTQELIKLLGVDCNKSDKELVEFYKQFVR